MLQLKGKRDKIRSANIYIIFHIHIIKFVAFLAPQKLLFVYKKKKAEDVLHPLACIVETNVSSNFSSCLFEFKISAGSNNIRNTGSLSMYELCPSKKVRFRLPNSLPIVQ